MSEPRHTDKRFCQCDMCELHRREEVHEVDASPFGKAAAGRQAEAMMSEQVRSHEGFHLAGEPTFYPKDGLTARERRDIWASVQPLHAGMLDRVALERELTTLEPAEPWPPNRLPESSEARKAIPIVTGLFDYFPDALAAVAFVSKLGNDKHNPGEPLHWARGKSNDHADCIGRHLIDRGGFDKDGVRHSACLVWRGLALLQEELEAANGLPPSRGSS